MRNINFKKHLILCLFLILFCGLSLRCGRPTPTGVEFDPIDTYQEPIQKSISSNESIIIKLKNAYFTLTPLAEYKISGMVVSRKTYSYGWDGEVSPLDLAIVWGKLAEPEFHRFMSYRQNGRWYFYKYKSGFPLDDHYIISHSSNNHIIPANKNVKKAVMIIGKGDKVVLEGFLVNLKGNYKGSAVTWNSSLTRTDTGNGSCEIFYVSKVRLKDVVYE